MGLFRAAALFIGGLTGSLAGIGALLYASGYLVTRAQLNLLGLHGLFEYGNEQFVQEGAKCLLVVGQLLADIALPLLVTGGLILVGLSALGFLILLWRVRSVAAARARLETWGARLQTWSAQGWCRGGAYALLLLLFLLHADTYPAAFGRPLAVVNLLYAEPGSPDAGDREVAVIREWLVRGDTARAAGYFQALLWGDLLAVGLLLGAWHVTAPWRLRAVLLAPFAIAAATYTVALPMAYGVLVRPTSYPVIRLTAADGPPPGATDALYLLSKTQGAFVLWDPGRRKVLWLPQGAVRQAEVQRVVPLFGRRPDQP